MGNGTRSLFIIKMASVGCLTLFIALLQSACSSGASSTPPGKTVATGTTEQKTSASTTGSGTTGTTGTTDTTGGTGNTGITPQPVDTATTTTISGVVTRSINIPKTGKGTLCVAIGDACLSMATYQTYKGLLSVSLTGADFTVAGTQSPFSFQVPAGKLTSGTTYAVIALLEDGGGDCWLTWKKNDLFSWQSGNTSPCASFTYQEGTNTTGLAVDMNSLVPFNYQVTQSQISSAATQLH